MKGIDSRNKAAIGMTLFCRLALLLTVVFSCMILMDAAVYAAEEKSDIRLASGTAKNITGGQKSNVYFGHYKQSSDGKGGYKVDPIKWRILSNGGGRLYLLADKCLDFKPFNDTRVSITWENCSLRTWLNDTFFNSAFSEKEQSLIPMTTIYNPTCDDKVFLLAFDECVNSSFGFPIELDNRRRIADNTDYVNSLAGGRTDWWLRTSSYYTYRHAQQVLDWGYVDDFGSPVDYDYAVRPALNLSLGPVLFTSQAKGGKASGEGADTMTETKDSGTKDWKLTVRDELHSDFKVSYVDSFGGSSITFGYFDAVTGDNEYISAVILDSDNNVKYYGRIGLAKPTDDRVQFLTIEGLEDKLEGTDRVYAFNEQYNGDYETDYASSLREIKIDRCNVTFLPGDEGVGEMYPEEVIKNGKYTLPKCEFTSSNGDPFHMWLVTSASGDSAAYKAGDVLKVTEDITVTPMFGAQGDTRLKNPLKASAKKAKVVRYKELKKKAQYVAREDLLTISKKKGSVTYKKVKVNKNSKRFTVDTSTGNLKIKKGTKKGLYKIRIKVTAAGDSKYSPGSKTVTAKVRVK